MLFQIMRRSVFVSCRRSSSTRAAWGNIVEYYDRGLKLGIEIAGGGKRVCDLDGNIRPLAPDQRISVWYCLTISHPHARARATPHSELINRSGK